MWIQNQCLWEAALSQQVVTWNISVFILVKNVVTSFQALESLRISLDNAMKNSWQVEFCSSDVMFGQWFLALQLWSHILYLQILNVKNVDTKSIPFGSWTHTWSGNMKHFSFHTCEKRSYDFSAIGNLRNHHWWCHASFMTSGWLGSLLSSPCAFFLE